MKQCQYCAEEIQAEAIKCKYCGEWIRNKNLVDINEVETILYELSNMLLKSTMPNIYHISISLFESILIKSAMKLCDDNQVRASSLLGITRVTLRKKLNENFVISNVKHNNQVAKSNNTLDFEFVKKDDVKAIRRKNTRNESCNICNDIEDIVCVTDKVYCRKCFELL